MANVESVEPIMNMVMNKPDEDTLEEVPQSPQQSPPSVQWNTPPHIQVAAMLVKVKEIESKLSSLTLNKLDLMTFLEELTTDLKSPETQAATPIQRTQICHNYTPQ